MKRILLYEGNGWMGWKGLRWFEFSPIIRKTKPTLQTLQTKKLKMAKSKSIWAWDLVKWIMVGSFLLFAVNFLWQGFNEESTRFVIRWTARVSAVLFCIAFGASAFHLMVKNSFSFWVSMNRKYWGISFAIIHLVHLLFLVILQYQFHPVFTLAKTTSLMAGGLAYLFIVLMLLTSFDYFAKYLSRKSWKALHLIGGHWIWVVFMSTNWKGVMKDLNYLPVGLLLVSVMLLRIWAIWKKSRRFTPFLV